MKKLLLHLALFTLLPSVLFADAGLKAAIAEFKAEATPKSSGPGPDGMVFPDVTGMIDTMFLRYPITHIQAGDADIYISDTEIYVIHEKGESPGNESWNLAVTADGVFEWQTGKKTGVKIQRNYKDIVGYLWYLIDPAAINTGLYSAYLTHPSKFIVLPARNGKWKEFQFKTPDEDGFEAVYIEEKPLWYHGFRMKTADGTVVEMLISTPEKIKKIPDDVKSRLKGIQFEDSPLTLRRHMSYF